MRAIDAAGNVSDPSNTATATVPDTTKPTAPGNLTATVNGSQVDLHWNSSSDDVGVTGYDVYRNAGLIGSIGVANSYSDTSLPPGTYSYRVVAHDAAGNQSDLSNPATATVLDTEKPTRPANLDATARGSSQVDLTWDRRDRQRGGHELRDLPRRPVDRHDRRHEDVHRQRARPGPSTPTRSAPSMRPATAPTRATATP